MSIITQGPRKRGYIKLSKFKTLNLLKCKAKFKKTKTIYVFQHLNNWQFFLNFTTAVAAPLVWLQIQSKKSGAPTMQHLSKEDIERLNKAKRRKIPQKGNIKDKANYISKGWDLENIESMRKTEKWALREYICSTRKVCHLGCTFILIHTVLINISFPRPRPSSIRSFLGLSTISSYQSRSSPSVNQ